jgi:hypothetical protein
MAAALGSTEHCAQRRERWLDVGDSRRAKARRGGHDPRVKRKLQPLRATAEYTADWLSRLSLIIPLGDVKDKNIKIISLEDNLLCWEAHIASAKCCI